MRPVRRTLGIEAFGVNAYTAGAGEEVVEDHDETGGGAGRHEELYAVVSGCATFTVGGARGEPLRVSPWEYAMYALGVLDRDPEEARRVLDEGVARYPDNASMVYNLACLLARTGDAESALEHLAHAVEARPELAEKARTDPDLESIRNDPRFPR